MVKLAYVFEKILPDLKKEKIAHLNEHFDEDESFTESDSLLEQHHNEYRQTLIQINNILTSTGSIDIIDDWLINTESGQTVRVPTLFHCLLFKADNNDDYHEQLYQLEVDRRSRGFRREERASYKDLCKQHK